MAGAERRERFCRDCNHHEPIPVADGPCVGFCTNRATKDSANESLVGFVGAGAVACERFGARGNERRHNPVVAKILDPPDLLPGTWLERCVECAGRARIQDKAVLGVRDSVGFDSVGLAWVRALVRAMFSPGVFGQVVLRFQRLGTGIGKPTLIHFEATRYPVGGRVMKM